MLFETKNIKDPIIEKAVYNLYTSLLKKRKIQEEAFNYNKWYKSLSELYRKQNKEHVTNVLNWYCKRIGDDYIPRIYSAETFKTRFCQVEDAMKSCGDNLKDFDISKFSAFEQSLLKTYPEKYKSYRSFTSEEFIKNCLINYFLFLKRFAKVVDRTNKTDLTMQQDITFRSTFIEYYLIWISQALNNWAVWNGKCDNLLFVDETKWTFDFLRKKGTDSCIIRTGSVSRWNIKMMMLEKTK